MTPETATKAAREVLSPAVVPHTYRVFLRLDFENDVFEGDVGIDVELAEPTLAITLNSKSLVLTDALVYDGDGEPQTATVSHDDATSQATLSFDRPLNKGRGLVRMKFSGKLHDGLTGLYKSTYELDGEKRVMALSQLEAHYARMMLPCFDQPDMKAVFHLTVDVPADCVAISNGEVEDESASGVGRRMVKFAPTPKMSTYLLALVVGELECVEKTSATGTTLRVWTTPGKTEQGWYALDAADHILSYFSDYFDVKYPLPKLDLIAAPDFGAGAMENYGAIIFRESCLLVGPETSKSTRQKVVEYMAHEIAHQWFGNLVTMRWWDGLWLNESFATWIGAKCSDALYPEFGIWPQFVNREVSAALRLDGMDNTHPVNVEVLKAADVDEVFDQICYEKGGSLMRMLEAYLGAEKFRDGLRLYMRRHALGNTETVQLWQALEESSDQPVSDLMSAWIEKPGYPVLTINSRPVTGDHSNNRPVVTQDHFRYGMVLDGGTVVDDGQSWNVPVSVRTDKGEHVALVTERTATVDVPEDIMAGASYVCLNGRRLGYYRVHYDRSSMAKLLAALAAGQLTVEERMGLEDDTFALCLAGIVPVREYLDVAVAYAGETEYAVWSNVIGHLGKIRTIFRDDLDVMRTLDAFGLALSGGMVTQIGWEPDPTYGESHSRSLLRPLMLRFAGNCGDADILAEACLRLEDAVDAGNAVHPDIRTTVYSLALAQGSVGDQTARFRDLRSMYRETESAEEKVRILSALGSVGRLVLQIDALSFSVGEEVRMQDGHVVVMSVANCGGRIAWNFLCDNWDRISKRYATQVNLLGYCITAATGCLYGPKDAEAIRKFFAEKKPIGLDRTIAQAVERVESNAAWYRLNRDELLAWANGVSRAPAEHEELNTAMATYE